MVKAKVFIYQYAFKGFPKVSDLTLEEQELPKIQDGEILAEAVYLSVDPYMRAYAPRLTLGTPMIGSQVAKIIESKNPDYPVGKHIVGNFGWRSHTIWSPKDKGSDAYLVPDFGDLPLSYALGVLGMPGNTAYFGLLEICQPKEGETVVVSGAAGAVGVIVGQIAKIKGCKVIGIAGSEEKGKWLKEIGFDHFINYKTDNIEKALKAAAPNGVDCYFDNVGGDISSTVIHQINTFGRIALCGCISAYNNLNGSEDRCVQSPFVFQQLKMEGFLVGRWNNRRMEGILQNLEWIKEGKLKYRETITNGFENMFVAFTDMLKGKNTGKAVVKV